MEYDTVKQKEKKISVKICNGSIWEDLKENLERKEDKKGEKKRLTVDVNVKREFRRTLKDDSWVSRIKSALTRGRFQDQEKKDSTLKQPKKEVQSSKSRDKDKSIKDFHRSAQDPEKAHEPDFIKEESLNVLSQTKKRLSASKEPSCSGTLKKREVKEEEPKEKTRNKEDLKLSLAGGDLLREIDESLTDTISKSTKHKANKYEVQINNNVEVLNLNEIEGDLNDEKLIKRQITKDKRSKSKPATAKEKLSETQGKLSDALKDHTLESIKDLKSSIISLRAVDKKLKLKDAHDKVKDPRGKRHDNKKKRRKFEGEKKSPREISFAELTTIPGESMKTDIKPEKNKVSTEDYLNEKKLPDKKRKEKKSKGDSSQSSSDDVSTKKSSSTVKLKTSPEVTSAVKSPEVPLEGTTNKHIMNDIILGERIQLYSSSCYTGTSSSEEHECSCGCMDAHVQICCESDSSESSTSSLEYLRSYSGNLIMCAHGKKPVLNEHIRYLSSCIKL